MLAHLCSSDVDIDVARNRPEIKYEQEPDLLVLGVAGQVAGRVCVPLMHKRSHTLCHCRFIQMFAVCMQNDKKNECFSGKRKAGTCC
jgi:hypothetical protein